MIPDVITIEVHDKDGRPLGCIKMTIDDLRSLKEKHNKEGIVIAYDMLMTSIAENIGG